MGQESQNRGDSVAGVMKPFRFHELTLKGKKYRLRWTFNDLANVEVVTGKTPDQLSSRSFTDLRAMVWAGMGDRYGDMSLLEVGELLDGINYRKTGDDLMESLRQACAGPEEPEEDEQGNG